MINVKSKNVLCRTFSGQARLYILKTLPTHAYQLDKELSHRIIDGIQQVIGVYGFYYIAIKPKP